MAVEQKETDTASVTTGRDSLICRGAWTLGRVHALRRSLDTLELPAATQVAIDGSGIVAMDSAGAWLLLQLRERAVAAGKQVEYAGFRPAQDTLINYIAGESSGLARAVPPPKSRTLIERWLTMSSNLVHFLAFVGETVVTLLRAVLNPRRIRWREILADMYETGVKALPIVGLLSFLMGVVMAYLGAVQLKIYGANIYVADLVGYAMLRELAPLLTAILVCGRTGSAYAAQIGTMQVREEVAALQTIGIPPMEILVLPKLFSLLVAMPLLAVFADVLSVLGGMVMANLQLGLGFNAFISRLEEAISYSTFTIGISKVPVFAAIIVIVGCYQGLRVEGSAESVGLHTTTSVVHSIFLVIVVNAMFAILFSMLEV